MEKKNIALLEFDETKTAKFSPQDFSKTPKNLPERCALVFSSASVTEIAEKYHAEQVGSFYNCTCNIPVYVLDYEGTKIALTAGFLGSAGAAAQMEELIAGGVKKIVACGSCGVLTPQQFGALVIPTSAVRDEGASFHYAPPSYEIEADKETAKKIAETLQELGLPHVFGKTWTSDAIYRETEEKIALRRGEGCITVEMECSAMIAVSQFRGVKFGQILFCGDDLSGEGYDSRAFYEAKDVYRNLAEYAIECVKNL